jgi:ankyrin repeat protein
MCSKKQTIKMKITSMLSRFKILLPVLLLITGMQTVQARDVADLVQKGDRKAALELISQGADVNALQPDGTSALHWAVYQVDVELVDALLRAEAKADVTNNFGSSALSEAITLGNATLVEKLLDAGADANYRNQDNQTALMLAASISNYDIAALLVERGADVNVIEKMTGQTALMWAASDTTRDRRYSAHPSFPPPSDFDEGRS